MDNVILFPRGIPGFESEHYFRLIEEQGTLFAQLLSESDADVGFVLVRAQVFFPDYLQAIEIDEEANVLLSAKDDHEIEVWTVLTLDRAHIERTTVNLKAPILINRTEKIGMQFILTEEKYLARTPLFADSREGLQAPEGAVG